MTGFPSISNAQLYHNWGSRSKPYHSPTYSLSLNLDPFPFSLLTPEGPVMLLQRTRWGAQNRTITGSLTNLLLIHKKINKLCQNLRTIWSAICLYLCCNAHRIWNMGQLSYNYTCSLSHKTPADFTHCTLDIWWRDERIMNWNKTFKGA